MELLLLKYSNMNAGKRLLIQMDFHIACRCHCDPKTLILQTLYRDGFLPNIEVQAKTSLMMKLETPRCFPGKQPEWSWQEQLC